MMSKETRLIRLHQSEIKKLKAKARKHEIGDEFLANHIIKMMDFDDDLNGKIYKHNEILKAMLTAIKDITKRLNELEAKMEK
tara:strand:+ start:366 stop:611 length:246 start_codon:yes stop_codon:yes gene_type:complete